MRIVFTCGGTAGHISPALAVANLIRDRYPDSEILFVGADDGMELDLVPRSGYNIKTVKISNFQRKLTPENIVHNLKSLFRIFSSRITAAKIIREFKPDIIVGTGGYASYPMLRQGARSGIPTALHESNAVPGLTTKLVMNHVDCVMVSFEKSRSNYPNPDKVRVVGMPVNSEFFTIDQTEARKKLGLDDRPLIISYWGSLGARDMNKQIADFMKLEIEKDIPFQHIHATGRSSWKWLPDYVKEKGVDLDTADGIEMREFIYNMPELMVAADMVICRAGAATIAECAACGRPTIFVPSPNVTDNHQEKNARILEEHGGAVVIRESECSGEVLFNEASRILSDDELRKRMGESIREMAVVDSAERILSIITDLISAD